MERENVLTVSNLQKSYTNKPVVNDLNFHVKENEIVGLLGTNGAGKTTTINMILGILKPTSGKIKIGPYDIETEHTKALNLTNFTAVYAPLPGNMTVEQNLRFFGMVYKVPRLKNRIEDLVDQFELGHLIKKKYGVLSSGEQSRVSLAKAMINKPQLLLLDEPTASLDPSTAQIIRQTIKEYARDNSVGVLWTSHNMHEVEEVCDRILFLYKGSIIMEGNPKSLAKNLGKSSLEDLFITVVRQQVAS